MKFGFLRFLFFFNDTATTEIYTFSLHDALPISLSQTAKGHSGHAASAASDGFIWPEETRLKPDRKSTRLNSSHLVISYAVFCLKKKKSCLCNRKMPLLFDRSRSRSVKTSCNTDH